MVYAGMSSGDLDYLSLEYKVYTSEYTKCIASAYCSPPIMQKYNVCLVLAC
jgi:hypothetical protein